MPREKGVGAAEEKQREIAHVLRVRDSDTLQGRVCVGVCVCVSESVCISVYVRTCIVLYVYYNLVLLLYCAERSLSTSVTELTELVRWISESFTSFLHFRSHNERGGE